MVKRSWMDVTELAHLFSTNICMLLCGCKNYDVVQGLQVRSFARDADLLVHAGLQTGRLHELIRRCICDFRSHLARAAPTLRIQGPTKFKMLSTNNDHRANASLVCPCAAGHQTTPPREMASPTIDRVAAENRAPHPLVR